MSVPAIYLAPLQGLTDHTFRKVFPKHFGGIDRAYTPYFSVNSNSLPTKTKLEKFLTAGCEHFQIIPQVLTNDARAFISFSQLASEMGINMVNLNMGCPYPVVTKKGKGAGMLPYPDKVDHFLEKISMGSKTEISLKVRLGLQSENEIYKLVPVFNRYPVKEIIIHPRIGSEYYEGTPKRGLYAELESQLLTEVIYNGDIFSVKDYNSLKDQFPETEKIMLGRGILQNPFLCEELKGSERKDSNMSRLYVYLDKLVHELSSDRSKGEKFPQGIKEFWWHLSQSFNNTEAVFDLIKVENTFEGYFKAVEKVFSNFKWK
ncbi:MAG TPA: tRNA-dihydrouridine synthase family protein [Bacteroidales bacterium]|nr:tRNA-dihydrouridine synthase family protein [Bacteroidales bacterium]